MVSPCRGKRLASANRGEWLTPEEWAIVWNPGSSPAFPRAVAPAPQTVLLSTCRYWGMRELSADFLTATARQCLLAPRFLRLPPPVPLDSSLFTITRRVQASSVQ